MKKSDQQNIIALYESQQKDEPVMEIDEHGAKRWTLNGKLHRVDGPAVEHADGSKWWYQNGALHRVDEPAVEYPDGTKWWYQNGALHRIDGPAVERANGSKGWRIKGTDYDNDVYAWAKAALEYQKLPSDDGAVKQYLHKILNNITDEEI